MNRCGILAVLGLFRQPMEKKTIPWRLYTEIYSKTNAKFNFVIEVTNVYIAPLQCVSAAVAPHIQYGNECLPQFSSSQNNILDSS